MSGKAFEQIVTASTSLLKEQEEGSDDEEREYSEDGEEEVFEDGDEDDDNDNESERIMKVTIIALVRMRMKFL